MKRVARVIVYECGWGIEPWLCLDLYIATGVGVFRDWVLGKRERGSGEIVGVCSVKCARPDPRCRFHFRRYEGGTPRIDNPLAPLLLINFRRQRDGISCLVDLSNQGENEWKKSKTKDSLGRSRVVWSLFANPISS